MLIFVYICCILCFLCAEASTFLRTCDHMTGRLIFKSAASLLFAAAAGVSCLGISENPQAGFLFPAFILCAAGDILLAAAPLISKSTAAHLLYGVGGSAFAAAHIVYFLFFSFISGAGFSIPAGIICMICFVSYTAVLFRKGLISAGRISRFLIFVYTALLALMVSSCVNIFLHAPSSDPRYEIMILSGGILFGTSDACLLLNDFGTGPVKPFKKPLSWIVMINYYLAQILFILVSVSFKT